MAMFIFLKYLSWAASRNCLQTKKNSLIDYLFQRVSVSNVSPETSSSL
jgi:hypothetical protein